MANRYWVGNGGDWSDDTNHWASSSGGSPSGGNLPTSSDNVFFDANSFTLPNQTVVVGGGADVRNCHNLDFTGVLNSPSFDSTGATTTEILVAGNYVGNASVNFTLNILLFFALTASTNTHIRCNGQVLSNVGIPASSANNVSVIFDDDFTALGSFQAVMYGTNNSIDANGFNVTVAEFLFHGFSGVSPTLFMGGGTWTLKATNFGFVFGLSAVDPILSADDSPIIIDLTNMTTSSVQFATDGVYNFSSIQVIGKSGKTLFFNTQNLSADSLNISGPVTIEFTSGKTYSFTSIDAAGTSTGRIVFSTSSSGAATLSATSTNFDYIDVGNNIAAGSTPFLAFNGVDNGGNTNWLFSSSGDAYLQNVFMIEADTDGTVQMVNVGKSDDGTPIFYELETQEIEFGNRAHLKGISDEIAVFTKFGSGSNLEAYTDTQDATPIDMSFDDRVNIGKNISLEGHYVTFRWFGQTSSSSPIFEGLYLENVMDKGMTQP